MATKSKSTTTLAAKKRPRVAALRSATPLVSASAGALSESRIDAVTQQLMRAVRAGKALAPGSLAPSVDLTSELNNIDFRKMIGGPLQAAVDAQVASSLASVNFINSVGFQPIDPNDPNSKRELVMVDFTHTRKDVDAAGVAVVKESFIKVPLLSMLQIPSLRIDHVEIIFNVKLNSVETSSVSDKLNVGAEFKAGWGPVSLKVSMAYQRQTAQGVEVKKEYALNVNVKAVQDEIPPGLEKILNLLAA
jgi:hypothetical protein